MGTYLLKEEFPTGKIYDFLAAEDMPYTMDTKNWNSVGGLEDKVGPSMILMTSYMYV